MTVWREEGKLVAGERGSRDGRGRENNFVGSQP